MVGISAFQSGYVFPQLEPLQNTSKSSHRCLKNKPWSESKVCLPLPYAIDVVTHREMGSNGEILVPKLDCSMQ